MNATLKILTLAIGLAAAGPWDVYANTTSPTLLRAPSEKISAANDYAYNELLKGRRADSITLVDINADAINLDTDTFSLGLKNMGNTAYKVNAEVMPSGSIVWQGTFGKRVGAGDFLRQKLTGEIAVDPMNYVQITRHKDAIFGSMRYNGESYEILPTTKGYAFVKLNPSFASHCDQHGHSQMSVIGRGPLRMKMQSAAFSFAPAAAGPYTAKILFGITREGYTAMGGTAAKVQARIDSMIATTNRVLSNSQTNAAVQSAGIFYFNTYNQQGLAKDKEALKSSTHAEMKSYRASRDSVKSDIAAIIGVYGGGLATVRPTVVADSTLASTHDSDLVFAHEVGHIYGGGHQPGSGSGSVPTAQAAGVTTGSYPFRTVMYTPSSNQTFEYFSNKAFVYQGQPMGSDTQNNQAVVASNAYAISALAN